MNKSSKKIGIDVMGVILPKTIENNGTVEKFMVCPALPNALESISKLVNLYRAENIFIISRCPEYAEVVIAQWLDRQKFFTNIGFKRSNVFFCRERADKAPIVKRLQITYFIDDHIDVLDAMKDIVANRILFTGGSNHPKTETDENITVLDNWNSIFEYIKR